MDHTQQISFGESALALDIVVQLTIDLLVQRDPLFGSALRDSLLRVIESEGPTAGTITSLTNTLRQIEAALA